MNDIAELTDLLGSRGAALIGYADLSPLPPEPRHGLPFGVCFAVGLDPAIVAALTEGPTLAYKREYERVNALIDELSAAAAALLTRAGHRAVGRPATDDLLDPNLVPHALPHKTVATLAGLGWIGKCALLVTESHGSAVRLGTVLTDAPVPVGEPVTAGRCGDCTACVDACPGGAPTGRPWQPGMPREEIIDVHACRDAMRGHAERLGHSICGRCIAVCPYTRRYTQNGD
jgi:epoxyqueuosine reductase